MELNFLIKSERKIVKKRLEGKSYKDISKMKGENSGKLGKKYINDIINSLNINNPNELELKILLINSVVGTNIKTILDILTLKANGNTYNEIAIEIGNTENKVKHTVRNFIVTFSHVLTEKEINNNKQLNYNIINTKFHSVLFNVFNNEYIFKNFNSKNKKIFKTKKAINKISISIQETEEILALLFNDSNNFLIQILKHNKNYNDYIKYIKKDSTDTNIKYIKKDSTDTNTNANANAKKLKEFYNKFELMLSNEHYSFNELEKKILKYRIKGEPFKNIKFENEEFFLHSAVDFYKKISSLYNRIYNKIDDDSELKIYLDDYVQNSNVFENYILLEEKAKKLKDRVLSAEYNNNISKINKEYHILERITMNATQRIVINYNKSNANKIKKDNVLNKKIHLILKHFFKLNVFLEIKYDNNLLSFNNMPNFITKNELCDILNIIYENVDPVIRKILNSNISWNNYSDYQKNIIKNKNEKAEKPLTLFGKFEEIEEVEEVGEVGEVEVKKEIKEEKVEVKVKKEIKEEKVEVKEEENDFINEMLVLKMAGLTYKEISEQLNIDLIQVIIDIREIYDNSSDVVKKALNEHEEEIEYIPFYDLPKITNMYKNKNKDIKSIVKETGYDETAIILYLYTMKNIVKYISKAN